ncbi:MAG: hypothetical protein EXR21_04605, partial [Flavobacteriaceae bacterium]|nr:hypothetical protein [Flavobacteriaceae bacterium]
KAQTTYMPLGYDLYHRLDRFDVKSSGAVSNHTALKPYSREHWIKVQQWIASAGDNKVDSFFKDYLDKDNPEWAWSKDKSNRNPKPIAKYFYGHRNALFTYIEPTGYSHLLVNPILGFTSGSDFSGKKMLYTNTRGAEVRGKIGDKLGFYSQITDNQTRVPAYIQERVNSTDTVLPGSGFIKPFKNKYFSQTNAYDYFLAKGYITFQPIKKYMDLQFGQDRNFIGNGIRSLILSDFSTDYLFLKLNTKIRRVNYMNLFTKMADYQGRQVGANINPKYMAMHHISVNVTKNLNFGLFESVVFQRKDSFGQVQGFELDYLNPIIFYRSVEHGNNSVDNSLLGVDWKWNFLHRFSLYGQLVLDEFLLGHIRARDGWWGNKYGIQAGMKYIDAFKIKNLDLQAEFNTVRPYTYTHEKTGTNYSHYGQPLAHPLGANFQEYILKAWYQPAKRLTVQATYIASTTGLDSNGSHWGSNIFADYHKRQQHKGSPYDLGHFIGQGVKTTVNIFDFRLTYMPWHNFFLDLTYLMRSQQSVLPNFNRKASMLNLSLRLNLPVRENWY